MLLGPNERAVCLFDGVVGHWVGGRGGVPGPSQPVGQMPPHCPSPGSIALALGFN